MADCCGCGQFCDFPWCDCDGNAEFRRKHKTNSEAEPIQDCGEPWCNYCQQVLRPKAVARGVPLDSKAADQPATKE